MPIRTPMRQKTCLFISYTSRCAESLVVLNLMNCWKCCRIVMRTEPYSDTPDQSLWFRCIRIGTTPYLTNHTEIESHLLDLSSKLVFCFAQSLLESPQQLVL